MRKRRKDGTFQRKYPKGVGAIRRILRNYQSNAARKNQVFRISFSSFKKLIFQNCHYCDSPPSNNFKEKSYKTHFKYSGLDRLDSKKGYYLWNVVPCCFRCNCIKSNNLSEKEMLAVGRVLNQLALQELRERKLALKEKARQHSTRRRK